MSKGKMNFQHSYMTKEKMEKGGQGVFSSQFKSYVSDGAEVLEDNIYGGLNREQVMEKVRANLRQQMKEANDRSLADAQNMQREHKDLREAMQQALTRTKEATRRRNRLKAKLAAEKSRQSNEKATQAEAELGAMADFQVKALQADTVRQNEQVYNQVAGEMTDQERRAAAVGDEQFSEEDRQARIADIAYFSKLKNDATENRTVEHHKNPLSLFRAMAKHSARSQIEEDIEKEEEFIAAEKQNLKNKTRAWNDKRKRDYDSGSFRKHYDAYDAAISRYRMLNRKQQDRNALPEKDVKEYVGEFDLAKLDETLLRLEENPYFKAEVAIKNKKAARGISDEDLLKSHKKITLVSEKLDEEGFEGRRKRYKLNSKFEGYLAARQFRADAPTALSERNAAVDKTMVGADAFRLKIDKKDPDQKFINSEDNVEIMQAKTGKWYQRKKILNGVFLNGEFISTDRNIIKGKEDASTIGLTNSWKKVAQREKVRKAVLKAEIFRLINAKTIQHAAGYGAAGQTGIDKLQEKYVDEFAAYFEKQEQEPVTEEKARQIKQRCEKLFDAEHDEKLLKKNENQNDPLVLPDETEAQWENILRGDDEEAKAAIPKSAKIKVAYDVIRQELHNDAAQKDSIKLVNTRIGQIIDIVRQDRKALMELALLLLSHDENPEYWDIAKVMCTEMMTGEVETHGFDEKTVQKKGRSNFKRALEYAKTDKGQMMRVALIDELTKERKWFDVTDIFESMMPTRWKQWKENVDAQRGYGAIMKQKALDGTITRFINTLFSEFVNVTAYKEVFGEEGNPVQKRLELAKKYTSVATSALNFGAIEELAFDGASEFLDKTTVVEKEKDGKKKPETKHSRDDYHKYIGQAFTTIKNLSKLMKLVKKHQAEKKKKIERRAKNEPNYNPKHDLLFLDNEGLAVGRDILQLMVGTIAEISGLVGGNNGELVAGYASLAKTAMMTFDDMLQAHSARKHKNLIDDTNGEFETLMKKENKDENEEEMVEVLKNNSQLQYGLSLARRKSKDEFVAKTIDSINSVGKSIFSGLKAGKVDKIIPPFKVVEAGWDILMSIVKVGTEMVQHGRNVKFNIGKMLGKKYGKVDKSILNSVLKRYTGISSADYLPDLARIFMSINTHVFMKEANTAPEKQLGSKIAQTLLRNSHYTEDKLGKVKVSDLMTAMGVKSNFHKILQYSLA